MNTVDVRTNFPPDDRALWHLHALAFGGGPVRVTAWSRRLIRHSIAWAGGFDADNLVAFVHVVWDGGVHGFLLDPAVHPSHQRRDLGTAVVATQGAASSGCQWLHVDYEPHLENFYRHACGFEATAAGLLRLGRTSSDPD